ncbi:DUF6055 domain-containing protein [Parabacteroides sp.]
MRKYTFILLSLATVYLSAVMSCSVNTAKSSLPGGKALYQPKEFAGQDWNSDSCEYSYKRMDYTDNFAIYWQKGFGNDLSNPPQLEGKPMQVDLENLKQKLEEFYTFYQDELKFVKEGSLSEKYRMMVMIQYSLEGTAYGGAYDDVIGAFWAAPNRLQDKKLNAVAHELGHSFQSQISADKQGDAWGGATIFEMCAQWMLWQVNPEWVTDENYHWVAFKANTHKAFLHPENMYRSPYILETWSEKHGLPFIAELFRQGKKGEDPVMTYKRMTGLSQEQFNDELFEAYRQLVNFDYGRVFDKTRDWANSFDRFSDNLEHKSNGWYQVKKEHCPENYGFNVIKLNPRVTEKTIIVEFKGLTDETGYTRIHSDKAGWRYGFVGVTEDGKSIHGEMARDVEGKATFSVPQDKKLSYLWLVVMGSPSEHWMNGDTDAQWPYKIKISGTDIE